MPGLSILDYLRGRDPMTDRLLNRIERRRYLGQQEEEAEDIEYGKEQERERKKQEKLKAKEAAEWEERKHQMDVEEEVKAAPEMVEYIKDYVKNKDWEGLRGFMFKYRTKQIKPEPHPREIEAAEKKKWEGRREQEYQQKQLELKQKGEKAQGEEIEMTEYLRDKGYDIPSVPTPNIEDVKSLYKHEKAKETTELKEAEKPPTDYSLHDEGDRLLGYFRDDPVRHDAIKKGLMQGIPPKLLKRELMKRNVLPYSKDITGREDFKEAIKRLNLLKGGAGRKILHDLGYSDAEIDAMGIM